MKSYEANKYVKEKLEEYLENFGIDTNQNFTCINPLHDDKNPSMSLNKNSTFPHCHCFSCGANYDTFDVIKIFENLSSDCDVFQFAYDYFALKVDGYVEVPCMQKNCLNAPKNEKKRYLKSSSSYQNENTKKKIDFTNRIEKAHESLLVNEQVLSYYKSRGLTEFTINKYRLGYEIEGYNRLLDGYEDLQSNNKKVSLYTFVLPYLDEEGKFTYFLTEISDRSKIDKYNSKYRKIKNIESPIFNERYIKKDVPEVIFICEGIYDALSVEEVGGYAIAFVGTAHKRFLSLCKEFNPNTTFVVSLDNDNAGENAIRRVTEGLDVLEIPYIIKTSLSGKDFNDDLTSDRELFSKYIKDSIKEAKEKLNKEQERYIEEKSSYNKSKRLKEKIKSGEKLVSYKTGFRDLDELLDGGLRSGLYCVGAISSLGKTTFCLQIVDNIAKLGFDCLIFSLEMSEEELIAKSISRETQIEDLKGGESVFLAKSTLSVLKGNFVGEDQYIFEKAFESYLSFSKRIYIFEGIGNIGIEQIMQAVEKHIRIMKKKPIVLIDYLQILSPYDIRMSDKQNIDKSVLELKRMSRDFDIPVICISSFNRMNYTSPVSLSSFKESGAIEYSSDVLIGLQYSGMDYEEKESDVSRNSRIKALMRNMEEQGRKGSCQDIQVKILKNRNGSKGSICLKFYPMFNFFNDI